MSNTQDRNMLVTSRQKPDEKSPSEAWTTSMPPVTSGNQLTNPPAHYQRSRDLRKPYPYTPSLIMRCTEEGQLRRRVVVRWRRVELLVPLLWWIMRVGVRLGRRRVWWARGRRTRLPACSDQRSSFYELQNIVLSQYSIRWYGTEERHCERGERNEVKGDYTHIFLMNRFDNGLDDTLHDTNVICIGLVVPDPHESPRLLIKVPASLDDPVIILFFPSFHPIYGVSSCENIVQGIITGSGTSKTYRSHSSFPTDSMS